MTELTSRAHDAEIAEALDLDEQIMEALGWERLTTTLPIWRDANGRTHYAGTTIAARESVGQTEHFGAFQPSSDPVAFESLLGEIGKRGLGSAYISRLDQLTRVGYGPFLDWDTEDLWRMWSAPQSTKAAAALAVLREATNG